MAGKGIFLTEVSDRRWGLKEGSGRDLTTHFSERCKKTQQRKKTFPTNERGRRE